MKSKYTQKERDRRRKIIERVYKINQRIALIQDDRDFLILRELHRRDISARIFDREYEKATAGR